MYFYEVYHAEHQNGHKYLSDAEIKEKALNSANGSEMYESEELLPEAECIEIYRFKGQGGTYVTGCTCYVLCEEE